MPLALKYAYSSTSSTSWHVYSLCQLQLQVTTLLQWLSSHPRAPVFRHAYSVKSWSLQWLKAVSDAGASCAQELAGTRRATIDNAVCSTSAHCSALGHACRSGRCEGGASCSGCCGAGSWDAQSLCGRGWSCCVSSCRRGSGGCHGRYSRGCGRNYRRRNRGGSAQHGRRVCSGGDSCLLCWRHCWRGRQHRRLLHGRCCDGLPGRCRSNRLRGRRCRARPCDWGGHRGSSCSRCHRCLQSNINIKLLCQITLAHCLIVTTAIKGKAEGCASSTALRSTLRL